MKYFLNNVVKENFQYDFLTINIKPRKTVPAEDIYIFLNIGKLFRNEVIIFWIDCDLMKCGIFFFSFENKGKSLFHTKYRRYCTPMRIFSLNIYWQKRGVIVFNTTFNNISAITWR
jgi:hypothetical protein